MAKGKAPAALKAHQFTKGSAKAQKAGAKGGKVSPVKKAATKQTMPKPAPVKAAPAKPKRGK